MSRALTCLFALAALAPAPHAGAAPEKAAVNLFTDASDLIAQLKKAVAGRVMIDELTLYQADDPACTPQVYAAGSGFVDQGGDVHVVRNEGSVDAVVYVTSIIPKGAGRRIDELDPGTCGF